MIVDETLDIDNKVFDVAKTPAPDCSLRDDVEPVLHLAEPRAIGGCIVHMIPWPCRQPVPYLGVLVRGIVVHHQMDIQVLGHIGIDVM